MGILTGDDGLVDAALSEILALPVDQKHQLDPQRHVDYLLTQHHLAQVHFHDSFCCLLCILGSFWGMNCAIYCDSFPRGFLCLLRHYLELKLELTNVIFVFLPAI